MWIAARKDGALGVGTLFVEVMDVDDFFKNFPGYEILAAFTNRRDAQNYAVSQQLVPHKFGGKR